MSLSHSPKIVTNGLVLCLDAGDPKSYNGSGTTWFDRSGNGYHAVLVNSPTHNGQSFNFDGSTQYGTITSTTALQDHLKADQTIMMWLKADSGSFSIRRNPINKAYFREVAITFETSRRLSYYYGGDTTNNLGSGATAYCGSAAALPVTLPEGEWFLMTTTRDMSNSEIKCYINGELLVTQSICSPNTFSKTATNALLIADGYVSPFKGEIATVNIYNKVAAAEEVLQNYNATKGRFGL